MERCFLVDDKNDDHREAGNGNSKQTARKNLRGVSSRRAADRKIGR